MNGEGFWDVAVLAVIFGWCVWYIVRRLRQMFALDRTRKSGCQGCCKGGSDCPG